MLDTTLDATQAAPAVFPADATPTQPLIQGWRKFFVDLKYLWLEQVLEVRAIGSWYLPFTILLPLMSIFGFSRYGNALSSRDSLLYIISGSAVLSVVNDGLCLLAVRVETMRKEGMLTYYASLPISRAAFVLAVILSRTILSLPGLLVALIVGPAIVGIQLNLSPWLALVLPLTAVSLAALGMAFGSVLKHLEFVQMATWFILCLLVMAAPIFFPIQALPVPLQALSLLFPPTYAADALRQVFAGTIGSAFALDIVVLLLMTGVSFVILNRFMSWRQD